MQPEKTIGGVGEEEEEKFFQRRKKNVFPTFMEIVLKREDRKFREI